MRLLNRAGDETGGGEKAGGNGKTRIRGEQSRQRERRIRPRELVVEHFVIFSAEDISRKLAFSCIWKSPVDMDLS